MKRILSNLLALCLLLGLTPAALGAEPVGETFQYTWSQEGDTHTVTRVDADGSTAFTYSGTSPWNTIIAIYEDAEVAHQVLSFVITLTTDVTLVGEPKDDADVQAIAFQDGTVCWELNGQTMTLQNLSLGAGINNLTTLRNGTVKAGGMAKFPVLYARYGGGLILDSLTVSRDDGGALVSAGTVVAEEENSSITITDSTLTTGVQGETDLLGNALQVNGENASMTLENTAVTGHAPTYPIASVTGGTLTVAGNSSITATAEKVTAAIVNGGHLYLSGGTLTPGAGGYAYGGRTNGTLHLSGGASASTVELRVGDQIVDDGYTGGSVVLTCTGGQGAGDLLVSGCIDEEAAKKFQPFAQNTVGLLYAQQENGTYTVAAAEAPVKVDDYTMTQDQYDRYIVTGTYEDGSTYVLVNEEASFKTTIDALFNDVQGTGATIKLGGDLTITGVPKGDGSYPTTGVGEGWITWDLQEHTLFLNDICMIAQADGLLTVKNGTVTFTGDKISPHATLFGAQENGKMVVEDVTATRNDGGCLLGAYPVNGVSGALATATRCALDNDRDGLIQNDPDPGSNAISVGEESTLSLVSTQVESGASWAVAAVYGTLHVDGDSSIASTETTEFPTAAVSSVGGTVRLSGALTGDTALRDDGGSHFYLFGKATAATIEVAGPGVVDATDYTGGNVELTYTGADVLMGVPLVTGCGDMDTVKKFTLTTGGAANIAYEEQPDGTWAAVAAATPLTDSVTEFTGGTVYSISSKTELELLAALVNSGNSGKGCCFVLTRDLVLEGSEESQWRPIGGEHYGFDGTFDGGGHRISGLFIHDPQSNTQGLFGDVGRFGTVRALTVAGQVTADRDAGGVVGVNYGLVEQCVSEVTLAGRQTMGGVVGWNSDGKVRTCVNNGSVSATGNLVGGIVGSNYNAVQDCIQDCVNTGAVEGDGFVGGIVGDGRSETTVTGCVNYGTVTGNKIVGGIVGNSPGAVADCANNGAILGAEGVGGIAGKLSASARVERSCNTGAVSATGDFAGGIVGEMTPPSTLVKDCFNTGDISAQHHAGGLAGTASNGASIQNGWNTGGVSAAVYGAGGICGQLTPGGGIRDCVSLGLSVSSGEYAGRVVGKPHSTLTLAGNFARSDMALTGGALTETTATQDGVDGESITLTGDWQKTAFAGWDFDDVWNEGKGDNLPTLKGSEGGITMPRRASGGGSVSSKPTVNAGEGGTVKTDGKGNVTITPDEGWRIASVTVNGKAVEIPKDGVLTGLKSRDKVVVTFEKIPPDPVLTPEQFTDLDPDAWYYDAVSYVLATGIFQGTSDTTFSPSVPMSRAMIFTVLHRIGGEAGEVVDGASWYAPALAWAVEQGISDGSNPGGEITREQLVTMLYRYAGSPATNGALDSFADAEEAGGYATDALRWAVEQGIITGKGGGILDPKGNATRSQVAAMLMRYLTAN